MTIKTQLEFNKFLKLTYSLTYRKPIMIFLTVLGFIMLITSALYFVGIEEIYSEPPFPQIIFGLVLVVFLPLSILWTTKKNYNSSARLKEPIEYEFTDDGINIIGESFTSKLDWTKTYKIIELNSWILIYQNKLVANIIPKESFGNKLSEFKELVSSKSGFKKKFMK